MVDSYLCCLFQFFFWNESQQHPGLYQQEHSRSRKAIISQHSLEHTCNIASSFRSVSAKKRHALHLYRLNGGEIVLRLLPESVTVTLWGEHS